MSASLLHRPWLLYYCLAGKLALLDVGAATAEQLQALKQHPSLQQAFTVYVSRQAALKASLEASPEAMKQQLASLETALQTVTAAQGLVEVGAGNTQQCCAHDDFCLRPNHH